MRRTNKVSIIFITIMIVAILGLTLAYAMFSKQLTISQSNATIKGNQSFSVKFSTNATKVVDTDPLNVQFTHGASGSLSAAKIDNSGTNPKITNLGLTLDYYNSSMQEVGTCYIDALYAINDGAFDAYLKSIKIDNVSGYSKPIVCLPKEGATTSSVETACSSISVAVYVQGGSLYRGIKVTSTGITHGNSGDPSSYSSSGNYTGITGFKLAKPASAASFSNNYISIKFTGLNAKALSADGPYEIKVGDITLEYSTQDS